MITVQHILFFVAVVVFVKILTRRRIPKGLKLPPGPPPKPIIGNILDMPTAREWETYAEWAKKYGEIVYLNVLGTHMVFLNSRRVTYELFDKRSAIYSDRTRHPMIVELMGSDWNVGFTRYGDQWRRCRRAIHEKFHPLATDTYKPAQVKHVRNLATLLLRDPEGYLEHLRHTSGAIIMEITYGIKVEAKDDVYITMADEVLKSLGEAGTPGRFLVDILPWMKYIPKWVPGADFKRKAEVWRGYSKAMVEKPFQAVKTAMAEGNEQPSFVSRHLEELSSKGMVTSDKELIIRNAAGTIYGGGADTTVSMLKMFILAMVLFPEVQRKAQQELDLIVGPTRLPEFEDKGALPYIAAICKETIRWHPLLPAAVPHASTEDDTIDGYFIPKGTLVFGNICHLLQNEDDFGPNTDKFNPDRFLQGGVRDPTTSGPFGFGRRICPGRFLAENSLFIAVATILHLFSISGPRDENGEEQPIEYEWESGFFSPPKDFKCSILPRSKTAIELIQENSELA